MAIAGLSPWAKKIPPLAEPYSVRPSQIPHRLPSSDEEGGAPFSAGWFDLAGDRPIPATGGGAAIPSNHPVPLPGGEKGTKIESQTRASQRVCGSFPQRLLSL
jgi:hypothetical protein